MAGSDDIVAVLSLATFENELIKQLRYARTTVGFFYIKDHGVSAIPGISIVIIGNMLARWLNDAFISTVHLVFKTTGEEP